MSDAVSDGPQDQTAVSAEEAWLNRLADEAEAEGREGSVTLEEMAALLGVPNPDGSPPP